MKSLTAFSFSASAALLCLGDTDRSFQPVSRLRITRFSVSLVPMDSTTRLISSSLTVPRFKAGCAASVPANNASSKTLQGMRPGRRTASVAEVFDDFVRRGARLPARDPAVLAEREFLALQQDL